MTNRVLNSITALGMVDHSQFSVCIPVCPRNVFEHLPRGTPGKWRAGKRAACYLQVRQVSPMECHGQFSAARNREQLRVRNVERLTQEGITDSGEKLQSFSVP